MGSALSDLPLDALRLLLRAALPEAVVTLKDVRGHSTTLTHDEAQTHAPPAAGAVSRDLVVEHPNLGVVGVLHVLLPAESDAVRAGELLDALGACLAQMLGNEAELHGITLELAARYEELNLLYTLDEQSSGYDPARGRNILQNMLEDCLDFLEVGQVRLHAPIEHLDMVALDGDDEREDPNETWPRLRERLMLVLRERRRGLAVNSRNEAQRWTLPLADDRILLAVPIHDGRGAVCGTLCTVKSASRAPFSNSDRKLLEVLAEQASRVVQASYSTVSGLFNRHGLMLQVTELLAGDEARRLTAVHLDVDAFGLVKESSGDAAGDALLRHVGSQLQGQHEDGNLAGHIGVDDFVLLYTDGRPLPGVLRDVEQLQRTLAAQGFHFGGRQFDVSLSAGVASEQGRSADVGSLLLNAEAACSVAKRYGNSQVRVYDAGYSEFTEQQEQAAWGPRVVEALRLGTFQLYAQPIVALQAGCREPHAEVLLRMTGEEGRVLAPGLFLPAAERYGLMPRLDRTVLEATLHVLAGIPEEQPLSLSVNVSGQSLGDSEFLNFVIDRMDASGVPFSRLCFEVTETAAVADFDAAVRFASALRRRGSRVSLDDFGSGLSSFGYLRQLPLDYIKIDGQIVRRMIEDRVNTAMVAAIHSIAVEMSLETIAEFVEGAELVQMLRDIGITYGQGYAFSRPVPIATLIEDLLSAPPAARQTGP